MADRNGYIGRAPSDSSVVVARQTFSPTGVTTDFTFASGYTVGYLDAYLNGARLIEGQDYNATDGSAVSLVSAATGGDVLELVAYKAFNVATIDTAPGNLTVGGNLTVIGSTSATNANYTGVVTANSLNSTGNINIGAASTLSSDGSAVFSGIVTASGGFNLGISSAGTNITSGPITTLNFVGTGNTFAVNGTTVDISIQGGSGTGGGAELDITASLFL